MKILKIIFPLFLLTLAACNDKETPTTTKANQIESDPLLQSESVSNKKQLVQPERGGLTIFTNGVVYTMQEGKPKVDGFVINDGMFVETGNSQNLISKYPSAKAIDLNGKTVVPGFIDAHGHIYGLGESLITADLRDTKSIQDIIVRLKEASTKLKEGQWLVGRGWDQNDWESNALPTKADLDAEFEKLPVVLERIDGHATWVNSAALEKSERSLNGEWQIEGGEIIRDSQNQATGVLIDNASQLIYSQMPKATDEEIRLALSLAMQNAVRVGLTSMHDAGTSLQVWNNLVALDQAGNVPMRIYAMADGASDMLEFLCENGHQKQGTKLLSRSVKLYSDGALGSRGAALLEDYSDDQGNRGLLIESKEALIGHAQKAMKCGLQVNIHAIGDRGNKITLDVLETAASSIENPGRHRVEHAQVIANGDFKRFKQLEIIASVQPTHATSDMYWAEDRVGEERVLGAYAWQELIENDVRLALGSDFPVEKPSPLEGFYAAITRQDQSAWPETGWYPEQRLTREQALHGFTLGAAYASFQEEEIGSIEPGKLADFVILSSDIMKVPARQILQTRVLATYVEGIRHYQHPQ